MQSPESDARLLLAHVLGVSPNRLPLIDPITAAQLAPFTRLVERRTSGVPLQHLTGEAFFRHVRVEVGPGVFVPRPETEVMTGWAVEQLRARHVPGCRALVIELCAGSGVISRALADEVDDLEVHAVEVSEAAAEWAGRNLAGIGVELHVQDMADALPELDGTVDLVIVNPPYIPLDAYFSVPPEVRDHDPAVALFSGADGLDAIRMVAQVAARLLKPAGLVCSEHADVQGESAPAVFARSGHFLEVRDHVDLAGRSRFVSAVRRARSAAGHQVVWQDGSSEL